MHYDNIHESEFFQKIFLGDFAGVHQQLAALSPSEKLALINQKSYGDWETAFFTIDYTNQITPLMLAANRGNVAMVEYLIENGADLSQKDNEGSNALFYAVTGGKTQIVDYLLTYHGHAFSLKDKNIHGMTPLGCAVATDQIGMLNHIFTNYSSQVSLTENTHNGLPQAMDIKSFSMDSMEEIDEKIKALYEEAKTQQTTQGYKLYQVAEYKQAQNVLGLLKRLESLKNSFQTKTAPEIIEQLKNIFQEGGDSFLCWPEVLQNLKAGQAPESLEALIDFAFQQNNADLLTLCYEMEIGLLRFQTLMDEHSDPLLYLALARANNTEAEYQVMQNLNDFLPHILNRIQANAAEPGRGGRWHDFWWLINALQNHQVASYPTKNIEDDRCILSLESLVVNDKANVPLTEDWNVPMIFLILSQLPDCDAQKLIWLKRYAEILTGEGRGLSGVYEHIKTPTLLFQALFGDKDMPTDVLSQKIMDLWQKTHAHTGGDIGGEKFEPHLPLWHASKPSSKAKSKEPSQNIVLGKSRKQTK